MQIPSVSEGPTITAHDVPDIEDLCTLCEPLPEDHLVTAYPMKASRKKAREELDIVNVVEWRHQPSRGRWFLLVRRPEGGKFAYNQVSLCWEVLLIYRRPIVHAGLLAGLHEFPTAQDQPRTLTASAMQDIPHEMLSPWLDTQLRPYARAATQRPGRAGACVDGDSAASKVPLCIASIKPAGDVIHVFSHIKKTYRVQWVVLEGGGSEPPALVRPQAVIGGAKCQKRGSRASRSVKAESKITVAADDAGLCKPPPQEARWLLMKDVPDAK